MIKQSEKSSVQLVEPRVAWYILTSLTDWAVVIVLRRLEYKKRRVLPTTFSRWSASNVFLKKMRYEGYAIRYPCYD